MEEGPPLDLTFDIAKLDALPLKTVVGMARRIEGELSEMVAALDTEQERLEKLNIENAASVELEALNDRLNTLSTRFDEVTTTLETIHTYLKGRLSRPDELK